MSKTFCPGQDTRYWRPGDIFDITCQCGRKIEFFKDESTRKCPGCGARIQNPKLSMGCAQWCQHAEECLGYDPRAMEPEFDDAAINSTLAQKIEESMGRQIRDSRAIIGRARSALQHAEEIIKNDKADAWLKLAVPAILLMEVDIPLDESRNRSDAAAFDVRNFPLAKKIMEDINLDAAAMTEISDIIQNIHSGNYGASAESTLVARAYGIS